MTEKQIESIKTVCKMAHSLIYTKSYKVSKFEVSEESGKIVKVHFQIERLYNVDKKVYQDGTVYIRTSGALYYINYLGNQKRVNTIQSVVSPFYGLEDSEIYYGFYGTKTK